jgi:hypothetical protein
LVLDEAEHLTALDAVHLLAVMLEYSRENFHLVVRRLATLKLPAFT